MTIKLNKKNAIIEWLLNGVTYKEIQERLGWLGMNITIEEIEEIEKKHIKKGLKSI